MVRDDRVYFHLYPVLVHLARTVGLPIEIVKYIRDEVRASGIRARQALKGHLQAGTILMWWLGEELPYAGLPPVMTVRRFGDFSRQRVERWKSRRLNWTPREERYWDRREMLRDFRGVPAKKQMARIWGKDYLDGFLVAAP